MTIGSVAQGNPSAAAHAERALALADQLGQHALRGYALMYRGSERLASGDSAGSRELDEAIVSLMSDPVRRARLGAAARALVETNRGAKTKTLAVITSLLPTAERPHGAVVRPFRVIH